MGIANLKPLEWAPIRFTLDDMLLDISGRLSFAHDYMKIAISDRYLHGNNTLQDEGQSDDAMTARRALHANLAHWFEVQFNLTIKAKQDAESQSKAIQEASAVHDNVAATGRNAAPQHNAPVIANGNTETTDQNIIAPKDSSHAAKVYGDANAEAAVLEESKTA